MSALTWKVLSEIELKPIVFLDKPIWQAGTFHLLVGRKNSGKGTFLAAEAARVTRGELGEHRNVIWIAQGEDSYARDVGPRILAAGGDLARVTVLDGGRLTLPNDINEILHKAKEIGDVGMIVIDPLGSSLRLGKSSNIDSDVRSAIACLNDLADRLGCIVTGVRHLTNKEISGGLLAGVLGSSDWVNIPRVVLALVHDDQEEDLRHLTVVTGNRTKSGAGRLYRIEGVIPAHGGEEVTRAVFVGDSHKDAEMLLDNGIRRSDSKSAQARELILDTLEQAPGQRMESDAFDAHIAELTGLAAGTIRQQRAKLKNAGLIRSIPDKDENGTVTCWHVARSSAPRPANASSERTSERPSLTHKSSSLDVHWTTRTPENSSEPENDSHSDTQALTLLEGAA
jgi:AAA domain